MFKCLMGKAWTIRKKPLILVPAIYMVKSNYKFSKFEDKYPWGRGGGGKVIKLETLSSKSENYYLSYKL